MSSYLYKPIKPSNPIVQFLDYENTTIDVRFHKLY